MEWGKLGSDRLGDKMVSSASTVACIAREEHAQVFNKIMGIDIRTVRTSCTTDWCYFLLLLAAVVERLFAPDRDSCVLALCFVIPAPTVLL